MELWLSEDQRVVFEGCEVDRPLPMDASCPCPIPFMRIQVDVEHFECRKSPPRPPGFCPVGTDIFFKNECTCPPGSKYRIVNRSHTTCDKLPKVPACPVGKRFRLAQRCRCPTGSNPELEKDPDFVVCVRPPPPSPLVICPSDQKLPRTNRCTCGDQTEYFRLVNDMFSCRSLLPATP